MVETGRSGVEDLGSWSAFPPTSNPLSACGSRAPWALGNLAAEGLELCGDCLGPGAAVRRPPAPAAPHLPAFPVAFAAATLPSKPVSSSPSPGFPPRHPSWPQRPTPPGASLSHSP